MNVKVFTIKFCLNKNSYCVKLLSTLVLDLWWTTLLLLCFMSFLNCLLLVVPFSGKIGMNVELCWSCHNVGI